MYEFPKSEFTIRYLAVTESESLWLWNTKIYKQKRKEKDIE